MINNAGYGVVYTPDSLSDYVAQLLVEEFKKDDLFINESTPLMVLDPACGEGSLLAASERAFSTIFHKKEAISYIGIDIEKDVIKKNTSSYAGRNYIFYSKDTLLPQREVDSVKYWKRHLIVPDLIIANPPWSSEKIYTRDELSHSGYKFDVGQYDSYVLFLELCLKLLKPNGYAAFIIPDSIFSTENRELRKFLSENTQLLIISRLGEKLFPGVNRATTVLVVKNARPKTASETVCFRLTTAQRRAYLKGEKTLIECHRQQAHTVLQKRFTENVGYVFDIDTKIEDEKLLKKLGRDSINWPEIFHFGRGVEISKSGMIVICPYCGTAQGFSKKQLADGTKKCTKCFQAITVSKETAHKIIVPHPIANGKEIYVGENIHRYILSGSFYIEMDVPGINYKDQKLYTPPKILIRKTGLGINACIDYNGTYISQTVYSCNYNDIANPVPLEYYLGVLNSRVLYYYYLKMYGENEWKSHPYFTKDILFSLPIPKITNSNKGLANSIAQSVVELQKAYSRCADIRTEKLVTQLYGLTADEFNVIAQCMNQLPDLGAINHMKIREGELCLDI